MSKIFQSNKYNRWRIAVYCSVVLIAMIFMSSNACGASDADIALLLKKVGRVLAQRADSDIWSQTKVGMLFNSGDLVYAGKNSLAAIMFTDDKSLVKVRDNSSFLIKAKRENDSIFKRIHVLLGQIWVKTTKLKSEFIIETPSGVAAIKGTEFYCRVEANGSTYFFVIDGVLSFENAFGSILINEGETGYAAPGEAPAIIETDAADVPSWGTDDASSHELEIEFQDSEGNNRRLKINY